MKRPKDITVDVVPDPIIPLKYPCIMSLYKSTRKCLQLMLNVKFKNVEFKTGANTCMFEHKFFIKSVIDRDGATCRNNNNFERPTIFNAP